MKALSVREPWASMIMRCGKDTENRTWPTKLLGPVVICAGKRIESGWTQEELDRYVLSLNICKRGRLKAAPKMEYLMPGYALGTVDIISCDRDMISRWDSKDCYHFRLAHVRRFLRPFPVTGRLGFFNIPDEAVHEAF